GAALHALLPRGQEPGASDGRAGARSVVSQADRRGARRDPRADERSQGRHVGPDPPSDGSGGYRRNVSNFRYLAAFINRNIHPTRAPHGAPTIVPVNEREKERT